MALLKKAAVKNKPVVLANNSIEDFRKFDNKTLAEVDEMETLVDIKIGKSTYEGNVINNLVLEYEDKKVAIAFSRKLQPEDLVDDDILATSVFRIARRKGPEDKEGDYANYSGSLGISFGKPSGITFEEETSLVNLEPAVKN